MVAFVVDVADGLPVYRRCLFPDVAGRNHVGNGVRCNFRLELGHQRAHRRLRSVAEPDEDEAHPDFGFDFDQPVFMPIQIGEAPGASRPPKRAVEIVNPAVEGHTRALRHVPFRRDEMAAATTANCGNARIFPSLPRRISARSPKASSDTGFPAVQVGHVARSANGFGTCRPVQAAETRRCGKL